MTEWDKVINRINEIIPEIEKEIFGDKSSNKIYKKFGYWFIPNDNIFSHLRNINNITGLRLRPPLNPKSLIKIFRDKKWENLGPIVGWPLSNGNIQIQSRADAIWGYGFLVAIYNELDYVVKSDLGLNDGDTSRVIKEAHNLKTISELTKRFKTNINVPNFIELNSEIDYPYFIQEKIKGKTLNDFAGIKNKLGFNKKTQPILKDCFEFSWKIYSEYGIKYKNIYDAMPIFNSINEMEKTLMNRKIVEKKIINNIFHNLRDFISLNKTIPCSFIHRDLSFNHIIISDEKCFLFDWGNSKDAPIIIDQIFYLINLNNKKLVKNKFNKLNTTKDFSFKEQEYLINMRHLLSLIRSIRKRTMKRNLSFNNLESRIKAQADKCYNYLDN